MVCGDGFATVAAGDWHKIKSRAWREANKERHKLFKKRA
jgi:hypothetical protein